MKSRIFVGVLILFSACLDTDSPSSVAQLQNQVQEIDDYLAANPPDPSSVIVKDATGIRVVISELGTAPIPPNVHNEVIVAYTGRLFSNNQVFDSRDENDPFYLKLSDNIIDGWKIGISLITEGAKAKLYIPSEYGYGANGTPGIPGNSILVFDINLMSVDPTAAQVSKLQSDIAAIDLILQETANVVQHESGIRYIVETVGTGDSPTLYDQVRIKFTGKLMSDSTVFQAEIEQAPSSTFSSRVANYLHGLIYGLQLMQVGDKVTFFIPSGLAFGPASITGIPANSNVRYEIELLEVYE